MGVTSEHIEAEITQTYYPGQAPVGSTDYGQGGGGGGITSVTSTITEQVRRRPLAALGLSLAAGSLLQSWMSGGQSGTTGSQTSGLKSSTSGAASSAAGTVSQAGSSAGRAVSGATDTVTGAAQSAGQTAADATRTAASTTSQKAQQVTQTATDTAQSVAGTATDAAQSAAQTATGVARQVADTAGDAVEEVTETVGDVAGRATSVVSGATQQVSQGAGNLGATVGQQVQQRPLTAFAVAAGTGAVLQPTLAPQVSKVTQGVGSQVSKLTSSLSGVSETASSPAPNQQELDQIREALVPATVDRATRFTSRDLRDYLDKNLEGVLGQTSLRAGVVAAVTEKSEEFVQNRLPSILNSTLSGTRGLVITGLAGALLKARNEAQQGQGGTLTNVRTDLAESVTETSKEQLQRYFPEFRERYQATDPNAVQ